MLTFLLVEDDKDLELEDIRCNYASNRVDGPKLKGQHYFNTLLLDLNLPRLDGLIVYQRLRVSGNDTPILMLTARDQMSMERLKRVFSIDTSQFPQCHQGSVRIITCIEYPLIISTILSHFPVALTAQPARAPPLQQYSLF
ncbi:response regulator [Spartinivicinus ruber]|uniref:response regulator n=1 Tax=Spartinivicinus ruber TaxID=2683272 RepID=UPI0013D51AA1|nr:response regulator [Spartinivicinus ruber]